MIPLTEWSRRRPPAPVFAVFDAADLVEEVDESGAAEFDGLLGDLIDNLQAAAAFGAHESLDAKCAGIRQKVSSDLDAKIGNFVARIDGELIQHFNAVLKPWIGKQIEATAMDAFCVAVSRAVGDELSQEIAVQAPEWLREKLLERFSADSIRTNISNSPDAELRGKVGATNISTEISAWQAKLDNILS